MSNTNETTPAVVEPAVETDNSQYIEAIEHLKATTVPRDIYEKSRAENKLLINALVSGEGLPQETKEKPSIDELRKNLFSEADMSNLAYVENALALRNSLIEAGERDPFLPYGDKVDLTPEQIASAEKVATALQEMVDFAEGDSGVFTAEYQRRVKDVAIPRGRR